MNEVTTVQWIARLVVIAGLTYVAVSVVWVAFDWVGSPWLT